MEGKIQVNEPNLEAYEAHRKELQRAYEAFRREIDEYYKVSSETLNRTFDVGGVSDEMV